MVLFNSFTIDVLHAPARRISTREEKRLGREGEGGRGEGEERIEDEKIEAF